MSASLRWVRTRTPWWSLVARLTLGALFAAAALGKVGDPQETVRAVRAYQLLPESAVHPLAYALPYAEIALALLLVVGLMVRLTALLTAAILLVFMAAVASAAVRGLRIDCGCFGGGGVTADPQYAQELLRDGAALAVALALAACRRSALSVDNALEL
ncbi:MAG: DoxX family membrane protein [Frankiaceae bacterium]|nr:DoxX family membrane protein [Frankiaceae bacterium]